MMERGVKTMQTDIAIAQSAEILPITQIAEKAGLKPNEILPSYPRKAQ